MKYINLLLLVAFMGWSWSAVHKPSSVPELVHASIQEELKQFITEYLQENLPSSKNLTFVKMWTEMINPNQVKASFSYSFDDENQESGNTQVEIEGVAILNQIDNVATNPDAPKTWSFDELYILNNHIVFKEGFTLDPKNAN